MFERFTDRARRVVVLAQDEARALNHNYIGTEHLLLGLIHEGEGVAAQVLTNLGGDLSSVRQTVMQMLSGYEGKETVNAGGPSKEGTPSGSAILDQFGRNLTAAAREGDPAALECYEQLTHWLGVGLADMCALLDPEVIVIAGGLAEAGDILLAPTRKAFAENLTAGTHRPAIPVVLAEGGQEAGLVGAADLARQP